MDIYLRNDTRGKGLEIVFLILWSYKCIQKNAYTAVLT